MALQSSGAISLLDISGEFGGSAPHSLSEYYGAADGVPSSGTIRFSDFYGTSAVPPSQSFTVAVGNYQEADLRTQAVNAGWNSTSPLEWTIPSGTYYWSDDTSTAGLIVSGSFPNGVTIINYGKIIGRGGDGGSGEGGNGTAGGPALSISSSSVTIQNKSGGYIAGGGGGGGAQGDPTDTDDVPGGGGAGGGSSGSGYNTTAYVGGAVGQVGNGGGGFANSTNPAVPGHHQGYGGQITAQDGGAGQFSRPTSGGRNPGGTTAGNAASGGDVRGGAGGYWGQAGQSGIGWSGEKGSGGSAGDAISASQSYSLSDNGTIYGAV